MCMSVFDALSLHNVATLCTVQHDLHGLCQSPCLFVYLVSHVHWTFPDVDRGVPYTVTVRALCACGCLYYKNRSHLWYLICCKCLRITKRQAVLGIHALLPTYNHLCILVVHEPNHVWLL